MARTGRPTKPRALKLLAGTEKKCRIKPEPEFERGTPDCPDWLDDEARAEWDRVVPFMESAGMLSRVDGATLVAYCQSWSRAVAAEKIVNAMGLTISTPQGFEQARPEVAIAKHAWAAVHRFASEYGMTPSSRSRVAPAEKPRAKAGKERFFGTA